MLGYIEKNLLAGETLLYKSRLHWIVLIGPFFTGLLLAGLGILLCAEEYEAKGSRGSYPAVTIAGLILLPSAAIVVAIGFVRRNSTEVGVSNKRVLIKTGFANRKSIEILLSKIESITVDESGFGRLFGYGSVIVRGTGGTFETFAKIAHPNEFRNQVQQQIGASEGTGRS